MSALLYIVGFLLFFHGIYQLTKYLIVISEIEKNKFFVDITKGHVEKMHKILVLVPVLHEEKNIEKFLTDLFYQDYPKNYYEVYIITTQKEYLEGVGQNTIDILEQIMSKKKFLGLQFTQIHYPNTSGFKAHQLDFAFNQIHKNLGDVAVSKSFFLFLDADSEIDTHTLRRFNDSIEDGTEIYQQPLIWFKNINTLKSPLMQSFAFLQSFFSVSYEIPMFTGKFFLRRLKYSVGHGLFIKGSFLIRIGGLPDTIEDVRLGRLSSFLGVKTKLVHGFGIVETAKSFPVYVKQSSVWFFGCGLFISDYLNARTLRDMRGFGAQNYIFIIYGFFKAFRWLNKGLFHFLGLIFSINHASIPLVILFSLSLLLNSTIPVFFVAKDFKMVWQKRLNDSERLPVLLRATLFSPILYMFNFVGPYYGLLKLLKFYLWGQITLPKTER